MLNVGHAWRDITPEPGVTLCGFAARCNRPSDGVDDPLAVHAVAVEQDGERVLLLVYDLLALGPAATEQLQARLAQAGLGIPEERRILCCTHTHSAPAAITLLGCGEVHPEYWRQLAAATAAAATEACAALRPATLRIARAELPGAGYNRRRVLADGRVVMTRVPSTPVVRAGPVCETMHLLWFGDAQGRGIVGLAHWAAHPDTVCSQHVSADYPGELRRRLAAAHGVPFVFLQGACGDINPPFQRMTRQEMLQNVDGIMECLAGLSWPAEAVATRPADFVGLNVALRYAPAPDAAWLRKYAEGMERLAATGDGPADTLAELANVLNVEPGQEGDPAMLRYFAGILAMWARQVPAAGAGRPETCPLALHVWRLGKVALCFVAAEVFAETALRLQAECPGLTVLLAGYASPLVGYLPTDQALQDGGYEVEFAYRCYGHPAAFASGSEPAVVAALAKALRRVLRVSA